MNISQRTITAIRLAFLLATVPVLRAGGHDNFFAPNDFKACVDSDLTSDNGDFARCLRDLFNRFQLRVGKVYYTASVADEMSRYGWDIKKLDRGLDVCMKQQYRFANFVNPVSLHVRFTEDNFGYCSVLKVYLKSSLWHTKLQVPAVFRDDSAWGALIASPDFLKRTKDRPIVSEIEISYMDLSGMNGFGRGPEFYGFYFDIYCRRDVPKLDEMAVTYCAASGLDPQVNHISGSSRPGSGRVLERSPKMELGNQPGEEIDANGKAKLFRYVDTSYSIEP